MEPCIIRRDGVARETVNEVKYTEDVKEDHEGGGNDYELDQLFLVHSDITSLLHQIDELVVRAMKRKTVSKQGTKEVKSFRSVLSNMLSTLEPWFPRLQEAVADFQLLPNVPEEHSLMRTSNVPSSKEEDLVDVESPEPTHFEPLVSPSPLVSWRGDHNSDKGRQLFHLTPLPLGKSAFLKHQNASKLTAKKVSQNAAANQSFHASKETGNDVLGDKLMKTTELGNSSPVPTRKLQSELLMTPCLKMSPPKTCKMFKPVPESTQQGKQGACKSTCSVLGASTCNVSQNSGSFSDKADDLCAKYPELLGIHHAPITRKTDIESSPVWWFSPPKTCVLMKPVNEKKPNNENGGSTVVSSFDFPNINHTAEGSMSMVVESTPLLKEPESVMTNNRTRAGETTLKKELWTRFEKASIQDSHFKTTMRGDKKKGFMEMLEEVSGNEEAQDIDL